MAMQKILVGIDGKTESLWPVIHALSLAQRVDMKVSVLFFEGPEPRKGGKFKPAPPDSGIKAELEALIRQGRLDGIVVDYYVAHGVYKDELIRFIRENGITLLVMELPSGRSEGSSEGIGELLDEVKLRSGCRIELVLLKDTGPHSTRS
ncbi:MAG: universal stress protein [Proteobacteria bacterium]|nr:universal stress protein [Pseudomonadota bacterium]